LSKDCLNCRHKAIGAHLVKNLLDLVWLGTGLGQQRRFAKLDEHFFGAGRDEGRSRLDENVIPLSARAWNVF